MIRSTSLEKSKTNIVVYLTESCFAAKKGIASIAEKQITNACVSH